MESSFYRVLCNRRHLQQLQHHHQQLQPFLLLSRLYLWTIIMKSQSHTFHEATSVLTTLPCISDTRKAQHPARVYYHYHAAAAPASTTAASPGYNQVISSWILNTRSLFPPLPFSPWIVLVYSHSSHTYQLKTFRQHTCPARFEFSEKPDCFFLHLSL